MLLRPVDSSGDILPVLSSSSMLSGGGDPCLVIFADIGISAWLQTGEAAVPGSARRHSLSDGFAFAGWRAAAAAGP